MDSTKYIEAYLTGTASSQEIDELHAWIHEDAAHKKEFEDACTLWYSLHQGKFNSEDAFNSFKKRTSRPTARRFTLWQKVSAVAAVAILSIGIFSMLKTAPVEYRTVTNNADVAMSVNLPDGSVIYLQEGASIQYPETFAKDKRTVKAQGTVFCEISRNENAPFIITDNDLTVEVLGTEFQINADEETFVIVESGKVRVTADEQEVILTKGERADFNAGTLTESHNEDVNFLSWKTGLLIFENAPLAKVISDMARHYHVTFTGKEQCANLKNICITGSYKDLSLSEMLETITLTIPDVQFEIKDNCVTVSPK